MTGRAIDYAIMKVIMELRLVEFWLNLGMPPVKQKFHGRFHTWGQRTDREGTNFFGLVEDSGGNCIELDPAQIKFIDV